MHEDILESVEVGASCLLKTQPASACLDSFTLATTNVDTHAHMPTSNTLIYTLYSQQPLLALAELQTLLQHGPFRSRQHPADTNIEWPCTDVAIRSNAQAWVFVLCGDKQAHGHQGKEREDTLLYEWWMMLGVENELSRGLGLQRIRTPTWRDISDLILSVNFMIETIFLPLFLLVSS